MGSSKVITTENYLKWRDGDRKKIPKPRWNKHCPFCRMESKTWISKNHLECRNDDCRVRGFKGRII